MSTPISSGRRLLALLALTATLAGCSDSAGFSFASRSAELGRTLPRGLTEIRMGHDPVVISAPDGFCFDQQSLDRGPDGGFALLARCENLRSLTRHRLFFDRSKSGEPAVISATISGPLENAQTPSLEALVSASHPVRLLASHPDALMPMIRMEAAAPGVPGTSTTQWRGAMAIGDRLIAVSLFAPEGSPYLGSEGAKLLREVARRSDTRSRDALPLVSAADPQRPVARPTALAQTESSQADTPQAGTLQPETLRPQPRPGSDAPRTVAQAPRPEKSSRRWRIANLFN
ncbi:hypothetical protein GFB49_08955 [Epibacterium sp. SM1979]|uniref:Uncharacterized protein n=1 Tax=Tritonibacter litoralis TaxID=2662264 RepID=A0A843YFG8_9RHOB|nr:hypothetical protein [Tritonibacter litoralis]MQQ08578.1 hypothetical protein [Tritonibacter litoralis]